MGPWGWPNIHVRHDIHPKPMPWPSALACKSLPPNGTGCIIAHKKQAHYVHLHVEPKKHNHKEECKRLRGYRAAQKGLVDVCNPDS